MKEREREAIHTHHEQNENHQEYESGVIPFPNAVVKPLITQKKTFIYIYICISVVQDRTTVSETVKKQTYTAMVIKPFNTPVTCPAMLTAAFNLKHTQEQSIKTLDPHIHNVNIYTYYVTSKSQSEQ